MREEALDLRAAPEHRRSLDRGAQRLHQRRERRLTRPEVADHGLAGRGRRRRRGPAGVVARDQQPAVERVAVELKPLERTGVPGRRQVRRQVQDDPAVLAQGLGEDGAERVLERPVERLTPSGVTQLAERGRRSFPLRATEPPERRACRRPPADAVCLRPEPGRRGRSQNGSSHRQRVAPSVSWISRT